MQQGSHRLPAGTNELGNFFMRQAQIDAHSLLGVLAMRR